MIMAQEAVKMSEGIILVNKPLGITSHDVVDVVRKKLKMRRIGHAGTLDPLAQGLLIVLVGKATKLFNRFADYDKEYRAMLKLGEATETGDAEGKVIETASFEGISNDAIQAALDSFKGQIDQVPPMVSAVRMGGKRLYELARRGIEVERPARSITIHDLTILDIALPLVEFYVRCSKGTYVRKLAEDIGKKLGSCAHVVAIKRTGIGPFSIDDAVELDAVSHDSCKKTSF